MLGTGKSRLVDEFKATLDLKEIQWLEGHAYAYSQNIPYFPLIDLLNGVFHIEEGDPPEKVKEKAESEIKHLVGREEDVVPYVGSLYSLSYPEVEDVSPEFWKSRLQDATQTIMSALARRAQFLLWLPLNMRGKYIKRLKRDSWKSQKGTAKESWMRFSPWPR